MSTPDSRGELTVCPPHIPTEDQRRQVRTMAACGMKPADICLVMNVCPLADFEVHYYRELATGALMANAQAGAALLSVAIDRTHDQFFQCNAFWMRAMAGWRDVRKVEKTTTSDLPEEQRNKLINQILDRLKVNAADFAPSLKEPPRGR